MQLTKDQWNLAYLELANIRARRRASVKPVSDTPIITTADNIVCSGVSKPSSDFTCHTDKLGNYAFERKGVNQ